MGPGGARADDNVPDVNLLVLGGTRFLGRHCVEAARARGHRVTVFNRGSRTRLWPDVEELRGDRDGGLDALAGRRWDAVIDPSGYVPRLVGASARLLANCVGHYTFVSSASVYRDLDAESIDEAAPVATIDDPASEDVATHYGALKALCEHAAEDAMPGRVLNVRAGLIVGPFDGSGRFAYWVRRVADGGEVLAPGAPDRRVQLVDARDLAEWIVSAATSGVVGTYNAAGPAMPLTMEALLDACRAAAGHDAGFTWVDDAFLVDEGIVPFTELPLWLPPSASGLLRLDASRAIAEGLRFRSLAATIVDVATTPAEADLAAAGPARPYAGLDPRRERALLDRWHARGGGGEAPAAA